MRERKTIRDPGAIQLLADDTRMKMIYLLRAKEMTVSQIADEIGLTPQTIYHHIKRLREAEMVEVSREERIEHLVESYYRATAGMFFFVDGACAGESGGEEKVRSIIEALDVLGFKVDPSDRHVATILKLAEEIRRRRKDPEIMARIYEMDDIDSSLGDDLGEFAAMMKMDDREFEKYLSAQRTLRTSLLSGRTRKREP